jgi:sugar phosphate isomerase/epimerase
MIKISFHAGGFIDKPLPWVIEHLSGLGYDAIELMAGPQAHLKPEEATPERLAELKAMLDEHGLAAAAINPYTVKPLTNMAQEGGEQEFYRKLIDIAVAVGAPTVNFLTGWVAEGDTQGWRLLINALKPLLHYAEERGVCMSIHNHEATIVDAPDKCLLLIDHVGSPNLKVLFDVTNFHILGCDVPWCVRRLGPHLVHCHAKGVLGKYPFNHFLVPGEPADQLDFEAFAKALGEIGYDRTISVEVFSWMRPDKAKIAYRMMSDRLAALGLRAPVQGTLPLGRR